MRCGCLSCAYGEGLGRLGHMHVACPPRPTFGVSRPSLPRFHRPIKVLAPLQDGSDRLHRSSRPTGPSAGLSRSYSCCFTCLRPQNPLSNGFRRPESSSLFGRRRLAGGGWGRRLRIAARTPGDAATASMLGASTIRLIGLPLDCPACCRKRQFTNRFPCSF